MEVKDRLRYAEFKSENSGTELRKIVFQVAESWADLLEDAMRLQPELPPYHVIEQQASRCRTIAADIDGITSFILNMATNVLLNHWGHGQALRRWFRDQPQRALTAYMGSPDYTEDLPGAPHE